MDIDKRYTSQNNSNTKHRETLKRSDQKKFLDKKTQKTQEKNANSKNQRQEIIDRNRKISDYRKFYTNSIQSFDELFFSKDISKKNITEIADFLKKSKNLNGKGETARNIYISLKSSSKIIQSIISDNKQDEAKHLATIMYILSGKNAEEDEFEGLFDESLDFDKLDSQLNILKKGYDTHTKAMEAWYKSISDATIELKDN